MGDNITCYGKYDHFLIDSDLFKVNCCYNDKKLQDIYIDICSNWHDFNLDPYFDKIRAMSMNINALRARIRHPLVIFKP